MFNQEFPNGKSRVRLIVAVTTLGLLLLYLLWGAYMGEVTLPGRFQRPDTVLRGEAIWVSCLFPVMWLIAEFLLNSHRFKLTSSRRKVLYVVFVLAGIGAGLISFLLKATV